MSNRLPVLLLPGDVFANRVPTRCCSKSRTFGDGTVSANDVLPAGVALFRPHHPARADHPGAGRAMQVLTDPAECGPVTLALCQDVQAEGLRLSRELLRGPACGRRAAPMPDADELAAAAALRAAKKPV
jgi:3D-(3,5/4)-trihydroxycyclohexane-1,2-dione acylhydrolase (decyclizing)